uniref:BED-type domain-containing protein n=1 Tax=Seriola dumerili TaxID=41447 RepID=A0A3B4VA39_SERDU
IRNINLSQNTTELKCVMAEMQRKQDAQQSKVWKYFTKADKTVSCNICKATLKYHQSTSAMHNHLKLHPLMVTANSSKNEERRQQSEQSRQTTIGEFSKRPITDHRKREITGLLVNFIVQDMRPLAAVSGNGFRDIIHFFELGYVIPSHTTLWKTITHQYDELRAQLASDIKDQSVSLTTDLWTSPTMEPYITVTAHYLTAAWEMKAKVLRTCVMPERHTAVNIAQRLTDTIREWGLMVFCVIHDNASSMNLAMTLCEDFIHDLGCTGHTLQLAIKAGLDLPEVAKAIDAARRVVSHFRHSAVATCALKKRQAQLNVKENRLQTDCPTRWNSTFTMLERLNEQRIPVQAVLEDETVTKPTARKALTMRASQWELIQQLLPVLRPLAKATTIMCGEMHVGLSFIYPVILNLVDGVLRVEESDVVATRNFKNAVRKQLTTRFKLDTEDDLAGSVPIMACILDPRFKDHHFLPENTRAEVKSHLIQLLRDGEADQPTATDNVENNNGEEIGKKKTRLESDYEELFGSHYASKKVKSANTCPEEVQEYLQMSRIPTMSNPLEWWARNEKQFPRLAKLARSHLAIPATSTPSERVFSLAGNTITRQRSSLHPAHVDALIFLNANQECRTRIINEEDFGESQ